LRVPIDAQAIGDGGVVITTGDIWVPLGGNVLLRVGSGEEQSPWDRFGSDYYNTSTLENVITDWSAFEAAFNITYRELEGCDEAYSTAEGAQTRYHLNVKWNDETQEKPGAEYDRWVARFMASERWLQMNGCPGAGDFTSVG
jgi:hypothetical protein